MDKAPVAERLGNCRVNNGMSRLRLSLHLHTPPQVNDQRFHSFPYQNGYCRRLNRRARRYASVHSSLRGKHLQACLTSSSRPSVFVFPGLEDEEAEDVLRYSSVETNRYTTTEPMSVSVIARCRRTWRSRSGLAFPPRLAHNA